METQQTTEPTIEEKRALFEDYDEADSAWEDAKAEVERLAKIRSEKVRAIAERCGKGPFKRNGSILKVAIRGETHFFKGQSKTKVEEI